MSFRTGRSQLRTTASACVSTCWPGRRCVLPSPTSSPPRRSATSRPTTSLISATTTVTSAPVTPSPYLGVPIALPGTFEAENFDKGGEGIAYHDLTPGNCANACSGPAAYRLTEDVDIIASSDTA